MFSLASLLLPPQLQGTIRDLRRDLRRRELRDTELPAVQARLTELEARARDMYIK